MPQRALAAVIQNDDRVLLGRRRDEKRHGGLWEFPGGQTFARESILEALQRELSEDLGVTVRGVRGDIVSVSDPGSDYVVDFVPTSIQGEPEAREHTELEWVPISELSSRSLAPADAQYVKRHLRPSRGRSESRYTR